MLILTFTLGALTGVFIGSVWVRKNELPNVYNAGVIAGRLEAMRLTQR